jgi:hypothetical protein
MAKFVMRLKFDRHGHSETAHRRFIEQMLEQVKVEIGRGHAEHGDIFVPPHTVIGSWQIEEDF